MWALQLTHLSHNKSDYIQTVKQSSRKLQKSKIIEENISVTSPNSHYIRTVYI